MTAGRSSTKPDEGDAVREARRPGRARGRARRTAPARRRPGGTAARWRRAGPRAATTISCPFMTRKPPTRPMSGTSGGTFSSPRASRRVRRCARPGDSARRRPRPAGPPRGPPGPARSAMMLAADRLGDGDGEIGRRAVEPAVQRVGADGLHDVARAHDGPARVREAVGERGQPVLLAAMDVEHLRLRQPARRAGARRARP